MYLKISLMERGEMKSVKTSAITSSSSEFGQKKLARQLDFTAVQRFPVQHKLRIL